MTDGLDLSSQAVFVHMNVPFQLTLFQGKHPIYGGEKQVKTYLRNAQGNEHLKTTAHFRFKTTGRNKWIH